MVCSVSTFMEASRNKFTRNSRRNASTCAAGISDVGLVGFRFNTIGVSDGMSMGTDGMSYSLQSRDLIADSIETVMSAQVRTPNSLPQHHCYGSVQLH